MSVYSTLKNKNETIRVNPTHYGLLYSGAAVFCGCCILGSQELCAGPIFANKKLKTIADI